MERGGPFTVLVIEDEIIPAMIMCADIKDLGAVVLPPVTSGEQAIRTAAEHKPDIVLADISLTGSMDGIEAVIAIREVADVAIVFVTGYDRSYIEDRMPPDLEWSLISKPFDRLAIARVFDQLASSSF